MKRFLLSSAVLLIAVGCGENDPPPVPPLRPVTPITVPTSPQPAAAQETEKPKDADAKEKATADANQPGEKKPEAAKPADQAAKPEQKPAETPGTVVGKAEVGVGAKGHYSEGIILTPVATIFRAEEMLAFKVQIPQAMNLFKAEHNRPPKSNEEFMERIIKANMIPLPELPEGQRFVYDPKTQELMVERQGK